MKNRERMVPSKHRLQPPPTRSSSMMATVQKLEPVPQFDCLRGLIYPLPVLYGAMGAGWYNTSIDYNVIVLGSPVLVSTERKQRFGWHFGGGVEVPVGSSAKLVGDIRYVFLDYDFKTFPGSGNVKSDFYVITVGLLFGLQ